MTVINSRYAVCADGRPTYANHGPNMVQSAQSSYDAERLHEMAERLGREQDFKFYNGGIDLDAVEAAHATGGRRWAYSE